MAKLLIVEDDCKTADALGRGLSGEGFGVLAAGTGEEAFCALEWQGIELVILDWMLPGRDGIEVLRSLRARGAKIPVLLLTARDAIEDRVMGLDAGADDYLVKPFAFAELLARIRALLRRSSDPGGLRRTVGDLSLDFEKRLVVRGANEIALTPREFDLLAYLVRYQGQTVTRQMLAAEVWRETNRATPLDNVIDVHVAHLRRKLDEGRRTALIHTVRGVGFVLKEGIAL